MFQRGFLWACGSAIALLFAASISVIADREQTQSSPPAVAPRVQPQRTAATQPLPDQALIQKYCASCHNDRAKTGGISFDGINVAEAGKHSEIFEKALVKLRGGMMPPRGCRVRTKRR